MIGASSVRQQFRRRPRGAARGTIQPRLSAKVREKYMEPLIPWQMHAQPLAPMDGVIFGLIGRVDMEGYAAHFAVGVPWFTTQSPFLMSIAPPATSDPFYHRRGDYARAHPRSSAIAMLDRSELRQKYAAIAERYLSGQFNGFHPRAATVRPSHG